MNGIVRPENVSDVKELFSAMSGLATPCPIEIHEIAMKHGTKSDIVVQRYRVNERKGVYAEGTRYDRLTAMGVALSEGLTHHACHSAGGSLPNFQSHLGGTRFLIVSARLCDCRNMYPCRAKEKVEKCLQAPGEMWGIRFSIILSKMGLPAISYHLVELECRRYYTLYIQGKKQMMVRYQRESVVMDQARRWWRHGLISIQMMAMRRLWKSSHG